MSLLCEVNHQMLYRTSLTQWLSMETEKLSSLCSKHVIHWATFCWVSIRGHLNTCPLQWFVVTIVRGDLGGGEVRMFHGRFRGWGLANVWGEVWGIWSGKKVSALSALCFTHMFTHWLQRPEYAKFAGLAGHVRRILKMSGEGVWSRRTKCPAKNSIFARYFPVKCLARIPNVRRRIVGSPDKMSGEAQMNFAYSAKNTSRCL